MLSDPQGVEEFLATVRQQLADESSEVQTQQTLDAEIKKGSQQLERLVPLDGSGLRRAQELRVCR